MASPVWAHPEAEPQYRLEIPAGPLETGLRAVVQAAHISIGGLAPRDCHARLVALSGLYSAQAALERLLGTSACRVRRLDRVTYLIEAAPVTPVTPVVPHKSQPDPLPDQVVLVTGRPLRLSQSSFTIHIVQGHVVGQNDADLTDLAAFVPGMSVTNLGPGRDKIFLRGVADSVLTGRTQSTVGLYLDDMPLTYNAPDPDLPLVDMARIEVLKGPQGALYGQGSLSGVIRMVANHPDLTRAEGMFEAGAGSTWFGHQSSRINGVYNQPVVSGKLGMRLSGWIDTDGGYINAQATPDRATNTTRRQGGRFSGLWTPDVASSLALTYFSQTLKSANSQYVTGKRKPYKRTQTVLEPHDNRIDGYVLVYSHQTPFGRLKVSANHLNNDILTSYDAETLMKFLTVPSSGVLIYSDRQHIDLSTQELSLTLPSGGPIAGVFGLFSGESREFYQPVLTDVFTRESLFSEQRHDYRRDIALFGNVDVALGHGLTLQAGLRYNLSHHVTDSLSNINGLKILSPHASFGRKIDMFQLSHEVGLKYALNPQSSLYIQSADGYRTGGINTTTLAVSAAPAAFRGDHLDSFEAGWRAFVPKHALTFSLVAYRILWKDIQSDQLSGSGLPVTLNLGTGTSQGLEIESSWKPTEPIGLQLTTQFCDPRLTRPLAAFQAFRGARLPYVPKVRVNLIGTWTTHAGQAEITNQAIVTYRGTSFLNLAATSANQIDGYTSLSLNSDIRFGRPYLRLKLENATDVQANSFAFGNPFTSANTTQITPLRPRTFWLIAGYRY